VTVQSGTLAGGSGPEIGVIVNGEPVLLPEGSTVADVVANRWPGGRGVAVALGREVVPRSSWSTVTLSEGAVLEVVTAVAGG
jgi:sulfur carrier protein